MTKYYFTSRNALQININEEGRTTHVIGVDFKIF